MGAKKNKVMLSDWETLAKVGYEFYNFCQTFEAKLIEDYASDVENRDWGYPAFCYSQWLNSYCNYHGANRSN